MKERQDREEKATVKQLAVTDQQPKRTRWILDMGQRFEIWLNFPKSRRRYEVEMCVSADGPGGGL